MQPRDEAGAAAEDAVEPRAQRQAHTPAGFATVRLEAGAEVPDQPPSLLLRGALVVGESVRLVHQPLGVHPAQRVPADVELSGVVAENHGLAQEFVRVDAAPRRALGDDPLRLRREAQRGQPEPVEMRLPGPMVVKSCRRLGLQTGDRCRRKALVPHRVVGGVVQHIVGVADNQQVEEFSRLFDERVANPAKAGVNRSSPICVQKPLFAAWRAPVSSTLTQLVSPARRAERSAPRR